MMSNRPFLSCGLMGTFLPVRPSGPVGQELLKVLLCLVLLLSISFKCSRRSW